MPFRTRSLSTILAFVAVCPPGPRLAGDVRAAIGMSDKMTSTRRRRIRRRGLALRDVSHGPRRAPGRTSSSLCSRCRATLADPVRARPTRRRCRRPSSCAARRDGFRSDRRAAAGGGHPASDAARVRGRPSPAFSAAPSSAPRQTRRRETSANGDRGCVPSMRTSSPPRRGARRGARAFLRAAASLLRCDRAGWTRTPPRTRSRGSSRPTCSSAGSRRCASRLGAAGRRSSAARRLRPARR